MPGGVGNQAGGSWSFAAGGGAHVRDSASSGDIDGDEGTFVWSDGAAFDSTGPNQFLINADGGVGIGTNAPQTALDVNGRGRFQGLGTTPTAGKGIEIGYDPVGQTGHIKVLDRDAYPVTWGNLYLGSGNVGIGTLAPAARLEVMADSTIGAPQVLLREVGADYARLTFQNDVNSSYWTIAGLNTAAASGDKLNFYDSAGGNVMSLTGNRKVGIGRDPATNNLEVEGTASKTASGSWLANSDRRIKKNIETIGSALDALDKVRLVTFEYTDAYRAEHESIQPRRYMNVIAQEFAEVFPDHVKGSGDKVPGTDEEILQVDPYPLTIYSAAAVQELHGLVKAQQAEIDGLKSRMASLEHALSANAQPSRPVSLASIGVLAIPALALLGFVGLVVRGRSQNGGGQ